VLTEKCFVGKYLGNSTYFQFSLVANMENFQNSDILNTGARHRCNV